MIAGFGLRDASLLDAYRSLMTQSAISRAMSDSIASVELSSVQIHTLDLHVHDLVQGADFATAWRVESGPGRLFARDGKTLLSYWFPSASSDPVVLRYDFPLPANMQPRDLHKLIVSLVADNSWHRIAVSLDIGGQGAG